MAITVLFQLRVNAQEKTREDLEKQALDVMDIVRAEDAHLPGELVDEFFACLPAAQRPKKLARKAEAV